MAGVSEQRSQRAPFIAIVVAALVLPMGIMAYSYEWDYSWYIQIMAMTYMINMDSYSFYFVPGPIFLLATLPFSFLRIAFLGMIWRAYNEKTTRRRALIVGTLAEIWFPLMFYLPYLISMAMYPIPSMYLPIVSPIPLLLVLGFALLGINPPRGPPTSWKDDDASKGWWEEESSSPSKQ
ncbi:MAG: hypothetical protein ACFFD6_01385 [Candidatus Thorarchaeota archaeon]